jgi:sugar phosphate isomerase/epimerase
MSLIDRIGVQSYCFRSIKDLPALGKAVKACGLERLELCGVHADFQKPETFAAAIATLRQGGVTVVSTGVNGIGPDAARARPMFEFLKACGAKHMSVSFGIQDVPAAFRVAEQLAEEFGVQLGIHNHGGYNWLGSVEALSWVFKQTSPRIGLCLDTAWAMQTGTDVMRYVEQFAPRLHAVHVKDFVFDRAGRWTDVVAGVGNLDLAKLRDALRKLGFQGEVIIEYEGDVNNPVPSVAACVQAVKQQMA